MGKRKIICRLFAVGNARGVEQMAPVRSGILYKVAQGCGNGGAGREQFTPNPSFLASALMTVLLPTLVVPTKHRDVASALQAE